MMTKRQWIVIGSLLAIFVVSYLLMQLFVSQKQEFARRPAEARERFVKAEPVEYRSISSHVTARGRVVSSAEIDIVAEASGKIEPGDVPLKKGQSFHKGDVLFTIYKDEMELSLKAQKSRFLNSVANLLADIRIDFPDRYPVFQMFFNDVQLEGEMPALPDVQDEKLKVFLASRNVLNDYYTIRKMEKQLGRHTVVAPFNGSYIQVSLEVGAYTNMGGRVARIIHTDTVEVEVPVENGNAKWIRVGDPVQLSAIDRSHSWSGRVVRVSDFVEPSTQARPVFVRVPLNNQPQLFAGDYLTVTFDGGMIEQAMEIPRRAVFNFNQVFVVQDSLLKKRQVNLVKVNDETIIFRGLSPGTRVVVQPLINVSENTAVTVLDDEMEPVSSDSVMTGSAE